MAGDASDDENQIRAGMRYAINADMHIDTHRDSSINRAELFRHVPFKIILDRESPSRAISPPSETRLENPPLEFLFRFITAGEPPNN